MSFFTDRDDRAKAVSGRSELVENLEALRRLPMFRDIPFEIIKLHAYTARRRRYPRGAVVFRQGQAANEAFLVLEGRVRLLLEEADGKMIDLQILEPGGFFGYMSLLAEYEWPLSAQVVDPADVLILDRHSFRKILIRYPEKGFLIVERLVQMRMARMKAHMNLLMRYIDDKSQLIDLYRVDGSRG
ncbi:MULTISPECIES: Crp/Fnr family transcriptional regulator [Desulfococcus]|uniref:Putative transcriptional regulator, Crp/Fnr family n=1 Tax=Desulfococcus multivorans DSM 2059 TaxID=1121405 RepID=S7U552_DESML|nr:cyclic nucleotide-binding domain-containing protein [Desulfococcus multivorans]EPR44636.1 putative transcriptional regulator, Crp/Fnr family [Desulfococcus multivorans DSM 2059]SKA07630.1 CRP/FNR family transcriptional regulator, anaerobic regulatory protein [Desulfococcus multivorans DSM 2059]